MGLYSINRRASVIGGTGFGGRQQAPLIARGQMFAGYDIPPQEVAELYKLYTQTGGPDWIDHTNWFENRQCSTWYGLTVAGGRVTKIVLEGNGLVGTYTADYSVFTNLLHWLFNTNPSLGIQCNLGGTPPALIYSRMSNPNSKAEGAFGSLSKHQQQLDLGYSKTEIQGALTDLKVSMRYFSVLGSKCVISGGGAPMVDVGVIALNVGTSVQTQASKDSIIERIYADRALFTYAGHSLNISGGPALTGTYQAANPPTTPAEKAYSLVNDNLAEGFLKWTITL